MIAVTTFAGKKVALFGLGASGVASASALLAGGADVVAFDDTEGSVEKARAGGIPVAGLRHIDWSRISALVLAPGVPLTHPAPHWTVGLARNAAVEVIGAVPVPGPAHDHARAPRAQLVHDRLLLPRARQQPEVALGGVVPVGQHIEDGVAVRDQVGAPRGDVLRMILRQGMSLVLFGAAVGVALAGAASRLLRSLLFGLSPLDLLTFAGAVVLFAIVGLVACYIPARRAGKVDPMVALRCD